jgi:hypothetical protein
MPILLITPYRLKAGLRAAKLLPKQRALIFDAHPADHASPPEGGTPSGKAFAEAPRTHCSTAILLITPHRLKAGLRADFERDSKRIKEAARTCVTSKPSTFAA